MGFACRASQFGGVKEPRTLIFSCLRDKPAAEMAQILFPMFQKVILAPIHAVRAASMDDLLAAAKLTGNACCRGRVCKESIGTRGGRRKRRSRCCFRVGIPGGRGTYLLLDAEGPRA